MQSSMHRKILALLPCLALMLLVAAISGCGIFSPDEVSDDGGSGGGTTFPPPTSPDQLMINFYNAYEDRNFEQYRDMLDTAFTFIFADEDVEAIGDLEPEWNRDDELKATEKMFGSQPGWDPVEQKATPAINKLGVISQDADASEGWELAEEPRFETLDAYTKRFRVTMTVTLDGVDTPQIVGGFQQFFVRKTEETHQGLPLWKVVGWRDEGRPVGS